ncbi:CysB family HTH-type transcriptional regulator [Candidatus Profftella armatura]|uniref:Regulatory protein CysB n=1 Tax=Candidatus Profftella armatura TaxID=669502 RepID=S5RQ49_9PROT|nr:CysB family HTH-type transcriptional regulator [Candidatus Profftella armatura]AGS07018.1 regulatory protein CysB [Candidatus Profftella armatura]ALC96078.1 transcriptional regulator [Candidatus Profftella armatura]QLK13913.1 CysB family HTH-type transcriptional regulator [Candidatus Profftella armatura]
MNLHQFRFVREAVRQNFNLTEAAKALYTSQPGVSKAIIELEEELSIDIFIRHGKRIRGLTKPGQAILRSIEIIMQEIEGLKKIGKEFSAYDTGNLTIATTHTQARYALPKIIKEFTIQFPKVKLSLLQGNPKQITEMIRNDQADIAIVTEILSPSDKLISIPCYQWEYVIIVPLDHPLLLLNSISLKEISNYPLITYDLSFSGRIKLDREFSLQKLTPYIVLETINSDIIKTYVELRMGIGIIASIAFDSNRDKNLRSISASHLFGTTISRVIIKQGTYLRSYVYSFIKLLSPKLNRKFINKILNN